jgi:tRNA threonylcarbamoyladenosine biosynthesis protein TsaB
MLVLGIDTSGQSGGTALVRADAKQATIVAAESLAGRTYSAQLIPAITALLKSAGLKKSEIEAIAVATGPGSFTGLRVGIAAAKGLAEILQRPLAAVSMLEAVASAAPSGGSGEIVALLDAGRGEAYLGHYRAESRGVRCVDEMIVKREALQDQIVSLVPGTRIIVTPDQVIADAVVHLGATVIPRPSPADIARLGYSKISAGEAADIGTLDANYIRRSDAELFSVK